MEVERGLAKNSSEGSSGVRAFQYNSDYVRNRPGLFGLIQEYLKHAARPTIAYPHVLLVGLTMLCYLC